MPWFCLPLWLLATDALAVRGRVAVVVSDDLEAYEAPVQPFIDALQQRADGTTISRIHLHGRESEARAAATRLRQERPDAIFCLGAKACWTVHQELEHVPTVYAAILDPLRYGIEGRQVTGITMTVPTVTYLGEMAGFFPEVRKVGVLRGRSVDDARIAALAEAAVQVGVTLVVEQVSGHNEVRAAFHRLLEKDIHALWLPPDRDILSPSGFRALTEEARRRHLPLLVDTDNMVRAGGMFSVVPDPGAIGRQAAERVAQILDGAAPAILELQPPRELLVVVNARALEQAEVPLDPLLRDFVDILIE